MQPNDIPSAPITNNTTIFLHGPAGAGKTTVARARLRHLLTSGVPPHTILVIVPQRTLGLPYQTADSGQEGLPAGESAGDAGFWAPVDVVTVGGLARRCVDLIWPLAARRAGFARPNDPPLFLTLETAQYYMSRQTEVLDYEGRFGTVRATAPRLASQVLDNLNKSAVVGFPIDEIGPRLKAAWGGPTAQAAVYDAAQDAAIKFRTFCLQHNLLDFSLQTEIFARHLLPRPEVQRFLFERYRHLIADNVEEDTPVAHDLLRDWLPHCHSALLVVDENAGYRFFLGADPEGARELGQTCAHLVDATLPAAWDTPETRRVRGFGTLLSGAVARTLPPGPAGPSKLGWSVQTYPFYPDMVTRVADEISQLTRDGVSPDEIVVLAPYLTDALRFSLTQALSLYNISTRSHRPSRSLADEPATRCLLTLAALAHPGWRLCPTPQEVEHALTLAIDGLDLVRAHLLRRAVYDARSGQPALRTFDKVHLDERNRITHTVGGSWDQLCRWLTDPGHQDWPLDVFLTMLFDEVLSRRGFGFHVSLDSAAVAARLIESVQKFRQAVPAESLAPERDLGQEYVSSVRKGILAATSLVGDEPSGEDAPPAVFLAPAYTFLLRNRPVEHQFWLDVGGDAWGERIFQPLTQPYVLSNRYKAQQGKDARWSDQDEEQARRDNLSRLVLGLSRRCRTQLHLAIVTLDESGREERGPLLRGLQRLLRTTVAGGSRAQGEAAA